MGKCEIIKSILSKIYVDKTVVFLALLVGITSLYREFGTIFLIIIIHEMGHILCAYVLGWEIKKIKIFPFGGCVYLADRLNSSLMGEALIMISGPLFQMVLFLIVFCFYKSGFIMDGYYHMFFNYHFAMLLFNLLPIYSLDGGRLLNILLESIFPYKRGKRIGYCVSYILIIVVMVYSFFYVFNLNLSFLLLMLLFKCISENKRLDYIYNHFLLERYLNKFRFKRIKVVDNKNKFYKRFSNVVKYGDSYVTEREYLRKRFRG